MTDVTVIHDNSHLPAHIAARFGNDLGGNDDLAAGVSAGFPIISFKGKVWHIVRGGVSELVENSEGEPRASLDVVIVKANPHISKVYYPGGYTEGSNEKPVCFSHDGVVPDIGATDRQAEKCAVCPHNAWGSRITENGAKGKSCADSRRVAVVGIEALDDPMLLRIPAGSLKDLMAFADMLNKRRTPYQAIMTKIGFDHTVAHQKLVFTAKRFLTEAETDAIVEVMGSDTVSQIIGVGAGHAPAPAAAAALDELGEAPAHVAKLATADKAATASKPAAAKPAAAAAPKAKPAPTVSADEVDALFATAEPAAVAPIKYAAEEDETPAAASPEPSAAAAGAKTRSQLLLEEADASLDSVLAGLDFDD